jgi:hypothetical protein
VVPRVVGSGGQWCGELGHGVGVTGVRPQALEETQPCMNLPQHAWRAGGRGAQEAPELHLEAHELCAAGQDQVEGVTPHLGSLG